MALTPLDIHNKDFPHKFRGFDPDAVDDFLDQVIQEFELLIKEQGRLKEEIDNLTAKLDQYRNLEATINKTLVAAENSAEEMKVNARKEAELIIQEARLQAERIIEAGHAKATHIMSENADLARAVAVLRTQVKALLEAQLSAISGVSDPFAQGSAIGAGSQTPSLGSGFDTEPAPSGNDLGDTIIMRPAWRDDQDQ